MIFVGLWLGARACERHSARARYTDTRSLATLSRANFFAALLCRRWRQVITVMVADKSGRVAAVWWRQSGICVACAAAAAAVAGALRSCSISRAARPGGGRCWAGCHGNGDTAWLRPACDDVSALGDACGTCVVVTMTSSCQSRGGADCLLAGAPSFVSWYILAAAFADALRSRFYACSVDRISFTYYI